MKVEWDYTGLAEAYLKRPDYSEEALESLFQAIRLSDGAEVCDMGAGTGHLTIPLAKRGFQVTAVEPNPTMRENGIRRTLTFPNVLWREGTGEKTGLRANHFGLVIYGSSFNVTDRAQALKESARILKAGGHFACLWNQRDLLDPLQSKIERAIHSVLKNYDYGVRRQDQTAVIDASGFFRSVQTLQAKVVHRQTLENCLQAWRSHATLHRQAGDRFEEVIQRIEDVLRAHGSSVFLIPYLTRIWFARLIR